MVYLPFYFYRERIYGRFFDLRWCAAACWANATAVVSLGALREENIRDVFRALVFESDDAGIQFN